MQQQDKLTKTVATITGNLARYALYFLVLVLVPKIAAPLAKRFDWCALNWSEPGQLRGFFTALFSVIFWAIALVIVRSVEKNFSSAVQRKAELLSGEGLTKTETTESQTEVAAADASAATLPQTAEQGEQTELSKEERKRLHKEKSAARKQKVKAYWKENVQDKPALPWKNVGALLLIVAACILLISGQIGFQVKPFYELGDKMTRSDILNKSGEIVANLVKCVWLVMMLRAALGVWQSLLEFWDISHVRYLKWVGAGAMLVAFGIYDVCATGNPFAWTYLAFYAAFTAIYYFSERNAVKSYLLIAFLYIF